MPSHQRRMMILPEAGCTNQFHQAASRDRAEDVCWVCLEAWWSSPPSWPAPASPDFVLQEPSGHFFAPTFYCQIFATFYHCRLAREKSTTEGHKIQGFLHKKSYSQFSITTGSHILVQFDHHQSHISDRCADIGFLSRTGGSFSGWCSARQSPHSHGSHWPGPVAPQPPTTFPSSVFSCHLLQPPPRLCLWFRLTYLVTKTQYVR